jgi:Skp family chaperone for outer membrane proteins
MKTKDMLRFVITLLIVLIIHASNSARADTDIKIAILDFSKVMSMSIAAKNIEEQLEIYRNDYKDQFSELERQLYDTEKKLALESQTLNNEEIRQKKLDFEQEILSSRNLVQAKRRALEQAANKAIEELKNNVYSIVSVIAEEKDLNLVLSKQNVILARDKLDITEIVIKRLNSTVKDIQIDFEG